MATAGDLAQKLGGAVGNVQNLVGAIELAVPIHYRSKYLQDRLEQAKEFLKEVENWEELL